jgi:hypothetical protein
MEKKETNSKMLTDMIKSKGINGYLSTECLGTAELYLLERDQKGLTAELYLLERAQKGLTAEL